MGAHTGRCLLVGKPDNTHWILIAKPENAF